MRISLISFFLLGFLVSAVFALMPITTKLEHFIIEDMFYYLRIAQYLVSGSGSTFDGSAPTNGYHPAWMLVSVALASVFSGENLVTALLLIAALLHGCQAAIIYKILERNTSREVSVGVTLIYVFNWRIIAVNLGGLETPLAVFSILIILDWLDRKRNEALSDRDRIILSIMLGLSIYTRMDLILFAAATLLFVWLLDIFFHNIPFWRATSREIFMAIIVVAVLTPWFYFSLRVSGALLPNSRVALDLFGDPAATQSLIEFSIQKLRYSINLSQDTANMIGLWPYAPADGLMSLTAAALLTLAVFSVFLGVWQARSIAPLSIVVWLCLGFAVLHVGYYVTQSAPKVRYMLPVVAAMALPFGIALHAIESFRSGKKYSVGIISTIFVISLVAGLQCWLANVGSGRFHAFHPLLRESGLWIGNELPNSRIGSWNAGIISFFSRAPVTNLDGVVNDESIQFMRKGDISSYIQERGLTHLADLGSEIDKFLTWFDPRGHVRTEIVATFSDQVGRTVEIRRILGK